MAAGFEGFVNFDPKKDIPSLEGKVILITGGTSGLGRESVLALARHGPAHIYFTGRDKTSASTLISEVEAIQTQPTKNPITFLPMDFSSLSSVKQSIHASFRHDRLDILICNAGIMAAPPSVSKDGYETQFAVNHLGNAMVIQQLLPVLLKTATLPGADVRMVSLTSLGWKGHPKDGITFSTLDTPQMTSMEALAGPWIRYGQSKLANIVYATELSRRHPQILSVTVHPGVVETSLVTNLPYWKKTFVYASNKLMRVKILQPEQGAYSMLWAAAGSKRGDVLNGAFYVPVGKLANDTLDDVAKSEEFAKELWDWTDKTLAKF